MKGWKRQWQVPYLQDVGSGANLLVASKEWKTD